MLKLAFIGCGRATTSLHLPAISRIPQVETVALADPDEQALALAADKFAIKRRFENYKDLLQQHDIDVVAVCTPAATHTEIALEVMAAGKHLFIEKPLALSLDDCDVVLDGSQNHSKKVAVGFNLRFHRLVQEARRIIGRGELGRIELVRTCWTSAIRHRMQLPDWRNERKLGGGAFLEIGVHHFDLWRYLTGSDIVDIFAASNCERWPDRTGAVTANLSCGALASAVFSEVANDNNQIDIYGEKGMLRILLFQFDGIEFYSIDSRQGEAANRIKRLQQFVRDLPKGVSIMRQGGDFLLSYLAEWQHFIAAIEKDTPVGCSVLDGKRAVQAALAAILSSDIRRPVDLHQNSKGKAPEGKFTDAD